MASTGDPLARHYRRLLLSYPRAYRRERGEEILGLLLDTAPAGRTRPTVREALDLVRGGLRCRLGRPASRTVGVWAALTALICGLFTAALAARLAWETSRPQADRAEASQIFGTVLPDHDLGEIHVPPALFVMYNQPVRWQAVPNLLGGDGGEYRESSVVASAAGVPPVPATRTLATARQRLRETGWHLDRDVTRFQDCATCEAAQPFTDIIASRGDTVLHLMVSPGHPPDPTYLMVYLQRRTPALVYPAATLAGLLGAAAGWLFFGWVSRRTDRPGFGAALAVPLLGTTVLLWWLPVLFGVPWTVRQLVRAPHPQWPPLWEWLGQPTFGPLFLLGTVTGLLGLALAARPGRQRTPRTRAAAG
ncbi:hypothetical protein GA0074695_0313 [Micromonospora viridifaciens]|uniref:Uncharacterized protein n=1 Tax=Micromonospora viridifaciens TaxID=1881 RepID=A0A1C4UAS9_MICVI|nr:hypothetical protein [Micromonospora viridifaciens]SCE68756.1 hypothetical protein GA0074695_0313 [Micromonospora viridifaciens]